MLFLKDVEAPRNTSETFSGDNGEDLEQSDIDKSDSNEDQEHKDNLIDIETTHILNNTVLPSVQVDIQPSTQSSTNLRFPVSTLREQKTKKKSQNKTNFEQQLLEQEKTKIGNFKNSLNNEVKDDDDMHFLKSIHPYFSSMTLLQKLRVRTQIHDVLMKEIFTPLSNTNQT